MKYTPVNGQTLRAPWPDCRQLTIVYLWGGTWGLLGLSAHADPRLTAPMFQCDVTGKWQFTADELWQMTKAWKPVDAVLVVAHTSMWQGESKADRETPP